jgi:hypothetical protein
MIQDHRCGKFRETNCLPAALYCYTYAFSKADWHEIIGTT